MKIIPKNEFLLLETFTIPKEQGKIILPNAVKDSQLYKVISGDVNYVEGDLVYLRKYPETISQGDNKFYLSQSENVIAMVVL